MSQVKLIMEKRGQMKKEANTQKKTRYHVTNVMEKRGGRKKRRGTQTWL